MPSLLPSRPHTPRCKKHGKASTASLAATSTSEAYCGNVYRRRSSVISAGWLNRPRRTGSRSSNEMKLGQAKLGARSNLLLLGSLTETVLLHCTFAYTVFLLHLYKLSRTSMAVSVSASLSLSLSFSLFLFGRLTPNIFPHTKRNRSQKRQREMGVPTTRFRIFDDDLFSG